MVSFKQFINEDPLVDLSFELAFRKEFGFSKEQSKIIVQHFGATNPLDFWDSMPNEVLSVFRKTFPADTPDVKSYMLNGAGRTYAGTVVQFVSTILRSKYNLRRADLRDNK